MAFVECSRLGPEDTIFVPMPLFHVSGLQALLTPLLAGSRSVIESRFRVSTAWDLVRRYGCTGMASVGPMLAMLLSLPPSASDRELPLRFIGTAPVPAPVDEIRERYGAEIQTMYGMTEAFPIAIAPPGEPLAEGSAGRPNEPAFEVRIVDDDGKPVGAGVAGEVIVRPRAPHAMFEGYFDDVEATAAAVRDGWLHTGDLGRVDADGFFYFVDRKKDALRRRGENISSIELEGAILEHPAVSEVAVHGVPSPLGEDDVKAVVVLQPGSSVSSDELFAFFDESLPRFARPRYLEIVEALPRNPVGRVQKFALRDRGITPGTVEHP
jgi:crotonobetaine/carnitine-CoA ligase